MTGRLLERELLDDASLQTPELEHSLREVWFVNRYLGGNPPLFYHLNQKITGNDPIRILDVATGIADIPAALLKWARRRKLDISLTGVDIHPQIVDLARKRTEHLPQIRIEQADGRRLPYPDGSFDIAYCNLALHHMDDDGAVLLLREMQRVSARGWIVTDLERHPAAYFAARLLARTIWRSPVTRHDGPLSVRRSFTAEEAKDLIRLAGVRAAVHRHFPYRLALVSHD